MSRLAASLALVACLWCSPALAEKRVALVIGVNAYPNLGSMAQLEKAVADSRSVSDTLQRLGFDVTHDENVSLRRGKELLFNFSAKLKAGDIAFVFFAGHGVALGGANYLLPSDIPKIKQPETEADIREEELRLAEFAIAEFLVLQRIKARGVRVGIVVLDACRDNPLRLSETANPFRSSRPGDLVFGAARGLSLEHSRPEGIFSLYSANFGQRALDRLGPNDTNPNSPFTRVFINQLATPGLGLREVMLKTRDTVVQLARSVGVEQRPALYDEVTGGDVFLAGHPDKPKEIFHTIEAEEINVCEGGSRKKLASLFRRLRSLSGKIVYFKSLHITKGEKGGCTGPSLYVHFDEKQLPSSHMFSFKGVYDGTPDTRGLGDWQEFHIMEDARSFLKIATCENRCMTIQGLASLNWKAVEIMDNFSVQGVDATHPSIYEKYERTVKAAK